MVTNRIKMKIAQDFEQIEEYPLPDAVRNNDYIDAFAEKLMKLSNRLNEIDDADTWDDALDIKEDYLPAIREFILNITGL